MKEQYRDTTVVIASSEDDSVFDCIDSVYDDANVVVSLTPSEEIERKLTKLRIPHVIVPRGNLGVTYNAGIELAVTDKIIIMNDDTTFNEGAIDKLSEGLEAFDACKPRIIFQYDEARRTSKVIAEARDFANSIPTRAFTPGLAINKHIKDRIDGHFFDENVRWAEDAEFSYRLHRSGLRFGYIEDATINHPPVSLKHDLRGAFLIGLSKRRAVELGLREGTEDFIPTMLRIISGVTIERKRRVLQEKGVSTTAYMMTWDLFYNLGYNLRKFGLSNYIERQIWFQYGRDERNE